MGLFRDLFGETKSDKADRLSRQVVDYFQKFFADDPDRDICIDEDDNTIGVRKGSAVAWLGFVETDEDDPDDEGLRMVVVSRLVRMPKTDLLPFYRAVLEMNHTPYLHGRLAVENDEVLYVASIDADLLDENIGAVVLVLQLMDEADFLDDHLIEELGAREIVKD